VTFCWKIDNYAPELTGGSEFPTDETKTARVLTIMRVDEYYRDQTRKGLVCVVESSVRPQAKYSKKSRKKRYCKRIVVCVAIC
jgi:hypothetical protein